jgi:phage-related protein
MPRRAKTLPAVFYQTARGAEPVREWLKELDGEDRKTIGTGIATLEFSWPVGLPTCRPIANRKGLWEIRSSLKGNRIARILFCIAAQRMVLLHGFVKKTQKTPDKDLNRAVRRMKEVMSHDQT